MWKRVLLVRLLWWLLAAGELRGIGTGIWRIGLDFVNHVVGSVVLLLYSHVISGGRPVWRRGASRLTQLLDVVLESRAGIVRRGAPTRARARGRVGPGLQHLLPGGGGGHGTLHRG